MRAPAAPSSADRIGHMPQVHYKLVSRYNNSNRTGPFVRCVSAEDVTADVQEVLSQTRRARRVVRRPAHRRVADLCSWRCAWAGRSAAGAHAAHRRRFGPRAACAGGHRFPWRLCGPRARIVRGRGSVGQRRLADRDHHAARESRRNDVSFPAGRRSPGTLAQFRRSRGAARRDPTHRPGSGTRGRTWSRRPPPRNG